MDHSKTVRRNRSQLLLIPALVTAQDDPVGFISWSPDGAWLAFNVAPGGGFNEQIYAVRPDGTGLRRLTEGGKENNFLGDWTRDGRFLTFSSNRREAASTDSYLLDVATGQMKLVPAPQRLRIFGYWTLEPRVLRDSRIARTQVLTWRLHGCGWSHRVSRSFCGWRQPLRSRKFRDLLQACPTVDGGDFQD
jgi:hypothetical protein